MKYRSHALRKRGLTEGYMRACGMVDEEFDQPLILVLNTWNELHPGHAHLKEISKAVKEGVRIGGGTPFEVNTISMCDGIRTPQSNKYILPSRELITDSIESTAEVYQADGMVLISTCDKIAPACLMAAARVNIPSIIVSGGPMLSGHIRGKKIENQDMNDAGSGYRDGKKMTEEEMHELVEGICGSVGGCWGMGTANTMACVTEAIGMSLPHSACTHAVEAQKYRQAKKSGIAVMDLVKKNIRALDIMTKNAFENALIVNEAIGGSTNSFLHIPAVANEAGIKIPIEHFDEIGAVTPQICNVMPAGPYDMMDIRIAGGIPAVEKELISRLDSSVLTVTGKTLKENLENVENYDNSIIRSTENPFRQQGSHAVVKGNLAKDGAVVKRVAVSENLMKHTGPAKVFDNGDDALEAIRAGNIQDGDVIVIRYEGPKGGPGMREMVDITRTLSSINAEDKVALITDGRFSGYSSGAVFGHCSPEAQEGGLIAIVSDGDIISYDIEERTINVELDDDEIQRRYKYWKPKEIEYKGYLRRYSKLVSSGADGAIMP